MIHHVSIPARDPRRVAEVLAELMEGQCHPFGPLEGAFMAASRDAHGSMIEVYPERATLVIPSSDDQVVFGENAAPPRSWPFHVKWIGQRAGVAAVAYCAARLDAR